MEEKKVSRETGMVFSVNQPSAEKRTVQDSTCDVCGKSMSDDENREFVAMHIAVSGHSEADRVLELFGKQSFNICFVCFLRALGVKELNRAGDG